MTENEPPSEPGPEREPELEDMDYGERKRRSGLADVSMSRAIGVCAILLGASIIVHGRSVRSFSTSARDPGMLGLLLDQFVTRLPGRSTTENTGVSAVLDGLFVVAGGLIMFFYPSSSRKDS